ncbi:MAG: Gfo/Idh/MocA family oxidoreductase, partial [Pseudomonadota bacterium]
MNPAETLVKIAVVGAGLIGKRHVSLLHNAPDYNLCAIIDPQDGAKKLAEEVGVPHFHELKDFLSSDVDCDGVILATPNETHREFALICISQGLPCLIEKPLASNSEDALAICEESESSGVAVLVGHHRRHHLVSRALKERLEKETLGKLVGGQLTWMLKKPAEYFAVGDWRTKKGGGPIWINLIHEIDLLRYFLGEIVEVSSMLSHSIRKTEAEDSGSV